MNGETIWSSRRRAYVVFLLSIIGLLNLADRQILSVLLEPIKHEIKASDTAMGLLTGSAFAFFYVAAGIPLAAWADRGVRRSILAGCVFAWSLMTASVAFAQNFLQLALARIGVAVGEAGFSPTSYSLLSDLYPPNKRGTVIGIQNAASSFGIAMGVFLGGWINSIYGWRAAMLMVGLPGVILAIVFRLTVKEPPRGMSDEGPVVQAGSFLAGLSALWKIGPFKWLLLTFALNGFVAYGFVGWAPTFFVRMHGLNTHEVGIGLLSANVIGHTFSNLFAGWLADKMSVRDMRWCAWIPAIGTIFAIPFGVLFLFSPSTPMAFAALTAESFFASLYASPLYAIALLIAPPNLRAIAVAIVSGCFTFAGLGFGPLAIGSMNDLLMGQFGDQSIRYSMLIMLGIYILSIPAALYLALRLKREMDARAKAALAASPAPSAA